MIRLEISEIYGTHDNGTFCWKYCSKLIECGMGSYTEYTVLINYIIFKCIKRDINFFLTFFNFFIFLIIAVICTDSGSLNFMVTF